MAKNRHTEPFRVVVDNYWPRTADDPHNCFYFEFFDAAQARYLKYIVDQVMETRLIERVSFERYNEYTGKYHPMFESFVHQSVESHGLDPNR